jgi:hypothetical protein
MPGEHGRWLYAVERRSPTVPSLRQPGAPHPIHCRESEPWTARTIHHGELVSECDDLQVQRYAGANEKAERVEQRDDDRRHESRLSKNAGNLNRHSTYGVFDRHRKDLDGSNRGVQRALRVYIHHSKSKKPVCFF